MAPICAMMEDLFWKPGENCLWQVTILCLENTNSKVGQISSFLIQDVLISLFVCHDLNLIKVSPLQDIDIFKIISESLR